MNRSTASFALVLLLVGTALSGWAESARAQYVEGRYWVTDGPVYAVLPTADTVYLGGSFTQVGPATGGAVVLDPATGEARQPYPLVDGNVYAVAPDGAGGWFLGGEFRHVASSPRRNLAHVDDHGRLTDWDPGSDGAVRALLVKSGLVYVGGSFSQVGGQSRSNLAAVGASSGATTAWAPQPNAPVWTLTSTNVSTLLAGGEFTVIGGSARGRVAEVDLNTGLCTPFNPNANGPVLSLWARVTTDLGTSRLYVAGAFSTLGGQPRANVGATDLFGTLLAYAPGTDGPVYCVRTTGGISGAHTVYLGGAFATVAGQARAGLASTNAGGTLNAWNPGASAAVHSIVLAGSTTYVAGEFTTIAGVERRRIAGIDAAGAATSFDPRANAPVHALALSNSRLIAAGEMSSVGGVMRNRLAALDRRTGAATPWAPSPDGTVYTMAWHDGVVYIGGNFQFVDGLARFHLAGIDALTGIRTNFNPVSNGPVFAMAIDGDTMFVGGEFSVVAGNLRSRLASLDIPTFSATAWNPGADRTVYALTLHERLSPTPRSTIFAGGSFTSVAGQTRTRVAEIDRQTGAATSWTPAAFDISNQGYFVGSIVPYGPFVFVGGAFYVIDGQPRAGIAALYEDTGQLSGWNPDTAFPCQTYAMTIGNGVLYAGGYFDHIGGASRNGLAALNPFSATATNWAATETDGTIGNSFATLVADGSTLFVAGTFRSLGGSPRTGFAALAQDVVAVDRTQIGGSSITVTAMPNPSSAPTMVRWRLPARAVTEIVVYDARGRALRRYPARDLEAGEHRLQWDGRDDHGRRVAAGVYFAQVRTPLESARVKIVRLE